MSTIYDIADLCGTSIATVSYVLNGNGDKRRISKATQEKIMKAAESLNYRPNTTAKRLQANLPQTTSIALFWPEFYFENAMTSALRAVRDFSKMSLLPLEVNIQFFEPDHLEAKLDAVMSKGYDGIILSGASMNDLELVKNSGITTPLVLVNRSLEGFPTSAIDSGKAGRMAAELAIERGGNDIAAIWEKRFHVSVNVRTKAFLERAEELGVDMNGRQFFCDGTDEDGYDLGIRMVHKKQLAKVIFCSHDGVARGFQAALNECGVKVGEDVLLFTANSGPHSLCRFSTPSITSIDLRMQAVIENALRMCLGLITRQVEAKTSIILSPEIVFRDSLTQY